MKSHWKKGSLLSLTVATFTAITILVLISAGWHVARVDQAHNAYLDAAALSLAQGGIEAAAAAIHRGQQPDRHPLGDRIELTSSHGELSVEVLRSGERFAVTSCGLVTSHQRRARSSRRCVESTIEGGVEHPVRSWRESVDHQRMR